MSTRSVVFVLVLCSCTPALARKWTDSTGKYSIEAELVAAAADKVQLKRSDGSVIELPISRLSEADQQYLKSLAEAPADFTGQFEERSKRAAGIAPDLAALALWCRDRQRPKEALAMQQAALEISPDDQHVRWILGQVKDDSTGKWIDDPFHRAKPSTGARLPTRSPPGVFWFDRNRAVWPADCRRVAVICQMTESDLLPGITKKNCPYVPRDWLHENVRLDSRRDSGGRQGNIIELLIQAALKRSGIDSFSIVSESAAPLEEILKRHPDVDAYLVASFEPEATGVGDVIFAHVSYALYNPQQELLFAGDNGHAIGLGAGTSKNEKLATLSMHAADVVDEVVVTFMQSAWISSQAAALISAARGGGQPTAARNTGPATESVAQIDYQNRSGDRVLLVMSGAATRCVAISDGNSWRAELPPGRYNVALIPATPEKPSRVLRSATFLAGNSYQLDVAPAPAKPPVGTGGRRGARRGR